MIAAFCGRGAAAAEPAMAQSLPNLLTLSRIVVIPALIAAFYLPGTSANWVTFAIFLAAGITDYFDGYFARRRGEQSDLGRFLDPVADKLLVAAAVLMLVAFDRIGEWPWHVLAAIVIVCREILVSGLREFLAGLSIGVPVSKLAKWKTGLQIAAITLLLLGDAAPFSIPAERLGIAGLWIAAVLTLYTGYDYLRAGLRHINGSAPRAGPPGASPRPAKRTVRSG